MVICQCNTAAICQSCSRQALDSWPSQHSEYRLLSASHKRLKYFRHSYSRGIVILYNSSTTDTSQSSTIAVESSRDVSLYYWKQFVVWHHRFWRQQLYLCLFLLCLSPARTSLGRTLTDGVCARFDTMTKLEGAHIIPLYSPYIIRQASRRLKSFRTGT